MMVLDTNVVVRFLVADDARQTESVRRLVERAVAEGTRCFVPDLVMCEVVWVLSSAYRIPRGEIVRHLGSLLRARQLAFASTDRLARALVAYRDGRGDFADYLIREDAREAGCEAVATFDKALLKDDGFRPV